MRIGLIRYGLERHMQGIARYTVELGAALERTGVEVVPLHAGKRPPGSRGLSLPGSRLLPGLLTVGQAELAWLAKRHGLDLVHDPTGCAPLGLARARRVTTIHDVIPYILPWACTRLDWLVYRCWLPAITPRLDAIVTISANSRADICRHLPVREERVVVVPGAAAPAFQILDEARVAATLEKYGIQKPYILTVGAGSARKNLPALLEAYALLRRWSSRWHLVAVGAAARRRASILESVERLCLGDAVHVTGQIGDRDLPALYNGADLFVFPSLYEGFGLPVLEAMACGTPVVTSDSSSLPEVAGNAALLVDAADPEEIALAMRRVLSGRGLAGEMRRRGLVRAALFTWENTARATVDVYERVLSAGRAQPASAPWGQGV